MKTFPERVRENLVIQELPDELLIYDTERDKAHCLNRTAALIWKQCDGRTSVAEITRHLTGELGIQVDERVVWYALSRFEKEHLLEEKLTPSAAQMAGVSARLDRRQLLHALGLAALVTLPVVTSIIAPKPAHAASCLPSGASCTAPAQCCSQACNAGICA